MDIETDLHYYGQGYAILAATRDECSSSYAQLLSDIATALYPGLEFAIEYLPSQKGSFLDRISFRNVKKEFNKTPIAVTSSMLTAIVSIAALFMQMSYADARKATTADRIATCIDIYTGMQKQIQEHNAKNPEDPIIVDGSQLKKACGDIIKKRKNKFYKGLLTDSNIQKHEIEIKKTQGKPLLYSVERKDFVNYIEDLNDTNIPSIHEIRKVRVEAPVIVNEDKVWRASDWETDENLNFYLKDHNFRSQFLAGFYPAKTSKKDDLLIGLFEFKRKQDKDGKIKVTRKSVINVFQYQNHQIKPIPDNLKQYLPKEDSFVAGDDELFPKYNFKEAIKDKSDDK
ncbi:MULTISPECIES: hypothetical protein [Candidatus Avelusimicrobium]|uniref:hypothetical protein n=1 Tax=Candidatus Avelusimicrobium TaxID=2840538 RepID=UPI003D0EBEC8